MTSGTASTTPVWKPDGVWVNKSHLFVLAYDNDLHVGTQSLSRAFDLLRKRKTSPVWSKAGRNDTCLIPINLCEWSEE